MKVPFLFLTLVLCFLKMPAQVENCGEATGFVIDKDKPSVYLTFEQFGEANDWKESKIGDWSGKLPIKKGTDVWLRLHNNSCWDITFATDSLYVSKRSVDGKTKINFGVLEDGAVTNVQYRIEEKDGRQVVYGAHGGSISSLPSGRSVVFGVLREHLGNHRSIYVPFQYGWEKKFSNNLEPMHRSYFWGYRLEEVKDKK
jgi:hypothetical protein